MFFWVLRTPKQINSSFNCRCSNLKGALCFHHMKSEKRLSSDIHPVIEISFPILKEYPAGRV